MSMSEVQKLTGLSARTLQYYDDMGYLRACRDSHGYRIYKEKDIQFIREEKLYIHINI